VTSRDESFLDLSVDVEQNTSVTGCLRSFSASETLGHKDKFLCDVCHSLQEAEKRSVSAATPPPRPPRVYAVGLRRAAHCAAGPMCRMRIKRLPYVLALHLKRFKFVDNQYKKLSYRVVFPFELRLPNAVRCPWRTSVPNHPADRGRRGHGLCLFVVVVVVVWIWWRDTQSDDAADGDRLYELFAVVIHIGRCVRGPSPLGHASPA
jgi:hypothetical protein